MQCPNCNNTNIQADATQCGECGYVFKGYEESTPEGVTGVASKSTGVASKSNHQNVTITNIDMDMIDMIAFMVKWAIASIPAFIILFLIGMMVMGVFGVGIATLFK